MFRVERHDITGSCYSTWDSFDEANAEYERQIRNAVGFVDEEAVVFLVTILRHTTVALDEAGEEINTNAKSKEKIHLEPTPGRRMDKALPRRLPPRLL